MRSLRFLVVVGLACALSASAPAAGQPPPDVPSLVGIRAAHHPGFDRLVFEFDGDLPQRATARWVDRVVHDGSGRRLALQGRAFISVVFSPAAGHSESGGSPSTYGPRARAFDLPVIAQVVEAGDFEATLSFGVGLMKRTSIVRKARLTDPGRFVVDISTSFRQQRLRVALLDREALERGTPPFLRTVGRTVPRTRLAESALMRLWAGPTALERAEGLRFRASGTTGFRDLSVRDGVARLTLRGACDAAGEAVTVADEVFATLKPFGHIRWVKILDRHGGTRHPAGQRDSIPSCLAP
jgi:hypothetical protein